MVRRREARVRTVLPVRVFGMDSFGKPFTSLAHTLDITNSGARLGGLQHSLRVGDIVGVQRGSDKARFRVAWLGEPDTRTAGQVGLECVQDHKNLWNILFEESGPDTFDLSQLEVPKAPTLSPPHKSSAAERRSFHRYPCDIGLEMQVEGSNVSIYARCTDISRGGCYVETRSPMPSATRLYICLKTDSLRIRALTEVRSSHPSMGMGLRFEQLGDDDLLYLTHILNELDSTKPPQPGNGLVVRLQEGLQSLRHLDDELVRYPVDPLALKIVQAAIRISRGTIDCCHRTLQEHSSPQDLTQALLAEELRSLQTLVLDLQSHLPQVPCDPAQLRALRSAADSLLEKLPDTSDPLAFETPFAVSNARPM